MTFAEYIDSLAKQGTIDGHIAECIMGKYRDDVGNPKNAVQQAVLPVLEEMWQMRDANGDDFGFYNKGQYYQLRSFADRIDDAIDKLDLKKKGVR